MKITNIYKELIAEIKTCTNGVMSQVNWETSNTLLTTTQEGMQHYVNHLPQFDSLYLKPMLQKIIKDMEYVSLHGIGRTLTGICGTTVDAKGATASITTNSICAGGVELSRCLIDNAIIDRNSKAPVTIFCNNKMMHNVLGVLGMDYGLRTLLMMEPVVTVGKKITVVFTPYLKEDQLLFIDMSEVHPMFEVQMVGDVINNDYMAPMSIVLNNYIVIHFALDFGDETKHCVINKIGV